MFKSLFSKYVLIFITIIIVSFSLLGLIMCSIITNYSISDKEASVNKSGEEILSYLNSIYKSSEVKLFSDFIKNDTDCISDALETIASIHNSLFVIITDESGNVILTKNEPYMIIGRTLSDKTINKFKVSNTLDEIGSIDGLLEDDNFFYGGIISKNGDSTDGYFFVCANSGNLVGFYDKTVKAIIISSLYVMLAAIVSVYFVSERIIGSLKAMRNAAKEFSSGKFDVRIPVEGEDEVAELATAFNNMATSLAKNEEMSSTFLANISHDLRTPMTTIVGFIEGIQSGAIPEDKRDYYLSLISSEVKRLSRLVSSLLDISRLQAGERKFVKTSFDICEMARQILISFEQRIEEKHLDVNFDCEKDNMLAYADKDAIYQVLYNICDNAVKFSKEKGKYIIKISSQSKRIYVSVYNEGIGIQTNELPFVFDRFYKTDKSRGLDKTGVGLGLYIVKAILSAQGEDIWVKSTYNEFCQFVFTLQEATDPTMRQGKIKG